MHFIQIKTQDNETRIINLSQVIDVRMHVGKFSVEYYLVTAVGPEPITEETYKHLTQEIAGLPYMEKYEDGEKG